MGVSSSKKKTTTDPWAPAQPFIIKGMEQTNQVFDQNQPMLQQMSGTAQNAFNQIAPGAFGPNKFLQGAQDSVSKVYNGDYLGKNPSADMYKSIMNGSTANPATAGLTSLAAGTKSPGDYSGIGSANPAMAAYQSMLGGNNGQANDADGYDRAVMGGKYLNAQPSAGYYADVLGGKYLNSNPYMDQIAQQGADAAKKAASQRFGSAGLGAGLSSAYTDVVSKNVADASNTLRYTDYNNQLDRMTQVGGQSDAAFANERNNMEGASGRISSNYNAGQDRALSAAGGLSSAYMGQQGLQLQGQQARDAAYQADRASQLAAGTTLGSQYLQGQQDRLGAAGQADDSYQAQIAAMLQASSLAGGLRSADYAGVSPALSLLNTAADTPYVGTAALNGQIRQASDGYGTSTTTSSPGAFEWASMLSNNAARFMPGGSR